MRCGQDIKHLTLYINIKYQRSSVCGSKTLSATNININMKSTRDSQRVKLFYFLLYAKAVSLFHRRANLDSTNIV